MKLLPPKKGTCEKCAVDHTPEEPHSGASLYYQYRFLEEHGRWPTWADAVAHCSEKTQGCWKKELVLRGMWSEPESGEPIAEQIKRFSDRLPDSGEAEEAIQANDDPQY